MISPEYSVLVIHYWILMKGKPGEWLVWKLELFPNNSGHCEVEHRSEK
jgi:hypothetical protein